MFENGKWKFDEDVVDFTIMNVLYLMAEKKGVVITDADFMATYCAVRERIADTHGDFTPFREVIDEAREEEKNLRRVKDLLVAGKKEEAKTLILELRKRERPGWRR